MGKLAALAEWLSEGKVGPLNAAVAVVAFYGLFQAVGQTTLAYWLQAGVGVDDAEQLMYLPYLQAGYGGSQPPIYTWINWAAAQLFGINVLTLKLVKYLLLSAGLVAVYATMSRLGFARMTAAAAMFGMLTIPQIVWESQRALSHSVAAVCFGALFLLSLIHMAKRQSVASYATFGLMAAAAVLAKYNNIIALGAVLAAAISIRSLRKAMLKPRICISLAVAVLALAPTALWNFANTDRLLERTRKFGIAAADEPFLSTAVAGVTELLEASAQFAIAPVIAFGMALAIARIRPEELVSKGTADDRLLWRTLGLGLLITAIIVIASGATSVKDRWLLSVLFLLPAAAAARIEPLGERSRKANGAVVLTGLFAAILVTPALWYVHAYGGSGTGRAIRLDYTTLYEELSEDGPLHTIVSDESWIGNFRLIDRDLNLLTEEVPHFARLLQEPAVLTWLDHACPLDEIVEPLLAAGYRLDAPIQVLAVPERLGGTRKVSFIRLAKQPASATPGNIGIHLCGE